MGGIAALCGLRAGGIVTKISADKRVARHGAGVTTNCGPLKPARSPDIHASADRCQCPLYLWILNGSGGMRGQSRKPAVRITSDLVQQDFISGWIRYCHFVVMCV